MDALKLIPQLFFDLIARVVPGMVGLVVWVWVWPSLKWSTLLSEAAAGKLDPDNAFVFAFFLPLGAGFVVGHLIAPMGKWLRQWTARETVAEPWRQYDWLRVHRPDAGALAAKIRAEYTMHFSLAAAFVIGATLAAGFTIAQPHSAASTWWQCPALLLLAGLSLMRGHETVKTFCGSVTQLYAVAQERPRPPDPPWSDEQQPPSNPN